MAMVNFMDEHDTWKGSATKLLKDLVEMDERKDYQSSKAWPKTPSHLSGRITRIAEPLRSMGIEVTKGKDRGGRYWEFVNRDLDE